MDHSSMIHRWYKHVFFVLAIQANNASKHCRINMQTFCFLHQSGRTTTSSPHAKIWSKFDFTSTYVDAPRLASTVWLYFWFCYCKWCRDSPLVIFIPNKSHNLRPQFATRYKNRWKQRVGIGNLPSFNHWKDSSGWIVGRYDSANPFTGRYCDAGTPIQ